MNPAVPATVNSGDETSLPDAIGIANPLWKRDGVILRQCAAGREHCLQLLLRYEASLDLHEPELMDKPLPCRFEELKSCVQVFNVLARPVWHEIDFALLEAYGPWAMRSELFRACVPDGTYRLRHLIDVAQEQWSRLHPAAPAPEHD